MSQFDMVEGLPAGLVPHVTMDELLPLSVQGQRIADWLTGRLDRKGNLYVTDGMSEKERNRELRVYMRTK